MLWLQGLALIAGIHYPSLAMLNHNFNIACETGIRYPSLVDMLNHQSCFHSFNPLVGCTLINLMRIPGTYSVHTSIYYLQTEYVLSTHHK